MVHDVKRIDGGIGRGIVPLGPYVWGRGKQRIDKGFPASPLSGQQVAYFLPRVVEFPVIVLTKHREKLLELFSVVSAEP